MANAFDSLLPYAKRAGLLATGLAAVIAGSFGWAQGDGWLDAICLAIGLALASFIVGYSLVFANEAWKRRMYGVAFAAGALFVVAVSVELMSSLGFTAANRKHDISSAQHQTTTYDDTRKSLDQARMARAGITEKRTPGQIEGLISALKARNSNNMERSAGCANPGMSPSFCRDLGRLQSALAASRDAASLDDKIDRLTAASASSSVGVAKAGAQSELLAAVANRTMKPSVEQQFWTNIGISALLAVFFVMSGLLNFIAYAFEPGAASAARPTGAQNDNIARFQAPSSTSHPMSTHASPRLEFYGSTGPARVAA